LILASLFGHEEVIHWQGYVWCLFLVGYFYALSYLILFR
jgi:hypothetical protein